METKRILIVDDEVPFTNMVKLNVERTGRYQVRVENQPTRALATAAEFRPQLILLDVVMPELDGGQIIAGLGADPKLKDIPVLLLTATVTSQVAKVLQGKVNCREVLAKPIDAKRLIQKLDEVLEASFFSFRLGRAAQAEPPA